MSLVFGASLGWAAPVRGQEAPLPDAAPVSSSGVTSPGAAFLRSFLVPGWGHASIGSYNRGAFYVALQGATLFTLVKTWRGLNEATERIAFRERVLLADLAAEGVTEPEEIDARLEEDNPLQTLQSLEQGRRQQREDWLALGIFLALLSGADAYVSAHLSDFPVPIELDAEAAGGGRMDLSIQLRIPN
jgi:hypothetical protein